MSLVEPSALTERFDVASSCGAVDVSAYSEAVSESFSSPAEAFAHYQHSGRSASPELFPFIDPYYYASQLDETIPETVTPFEHYVTCGAKKGLGPIPLFDPQFLRLRGGERITFTDIFDYLSNPAGASLDPHFLFSRRYYNSVHTDVAESGVDAFLHFVRWGWNERRAIHPFFQAHEYQRFQFPADCDRYGFNRYLVAACANPVLASTQPLFDVSHYLRSLGKSEDPPTPLQHYLTAGWRQNSSPFPLFDQAFFLAQLPPIDDLANPYVEYLSDFSHAYAPNRSFDPQFYLGAAGGADNFKGSLLEHFVRLGAANGARPHRMVAVTNAYPSRYSGFDATASFADISGRQIWLCSPTDDPTLKAQLDDVRDIEPSLSSDLLDHCSLHRYSGPVDKHERASIAITRKIARCNCLVVSETALDDDVISRLFSPSMSLVSNARPWLTLFCCSDPTIRYWHQYHGCKVAIGSMMPDDLADKAFFVASAVIAAIPNRLVVKTDSFGVALLRVCGSELLSAIPQVSLLLELIDLESKDDHWLREFVAVNYSEFASLIVSKWTADLAIEAQLTTRADLPRVVSL